MKTLLVTDTNSILNRAFYGIRANLTTKDGLPTNAVYGMVNIIAKQLDSISPDFAAAAFDRREKTFRSDIFADYKAHRKPMPDELAVQMEPAKECLSALGLTILEIPGYEADDIIGTVATAAAREGIKAYILTGDKDSLQLVDENVTVLLMTNTEVVVYDVDKFKEVYGIPPSRFVDVKALMGDPSDNIPGVPGIGEKTALKLIAEFGSLEAIYENIEDKRITPSIRAKLTNRRDNAFMSRRLAAIAQDVPLNRTVGDLATHGNDKEALLAVFTRLGFASIIKRFALEEAGATAAPKVKEAGGDELLSRLRDKTIAILHDPDSDGLYIWQGDTC